MLIPPLTKIECMHSIKQQRDTLIKYNTVKHYFTPIIKYFQNPIHFCLSRKPNICLTVVRTLIHCGDAQKKREATQYPNRNQVAS